jgi:U3 small nucleolar ribonucleoprotein component
MERVEIEIRGHDDHDGRYTVSVADDGYTTCERMGDEMAVEEMADVVNAASGEMDAEHVEIALDLLAEMDAEGDEDEGGDTADADAEETTVAGTTFRHGDRLVGDDRAFDVHVRDGQLKLQDGPSRPRSADAQWVESLLDSGYEIERGAGA